MFIPQLQQTSSTPRPDTAPTVGNGLDATPNTPRDTYVPQFTMAATARKFQQQEQEFMRKRGLSPEKIAEINQQTAEFVNQCQRNERELLESGKMFQMMDQLRKLPRF